MSETMTIKRFADFACEDGDGDAAVFAAAAHRFCEALETMDRHASVCDAVLQLLAIHYGPENLADHGIAVHTGPTGWNLEGARAAIRALMGEKAPDDLDDYSERRLRALSEALMPDDFYDRHKPEALAEQLLEVVNAIMEQLCGHDCKLWTAN